MQPSDWFWEGHVQARVADHLRDVGWIILAEADTVSRQTGIDLVAERENERLNVEVKGWPSTTYRRGPKAGEPKPTRPSTQARHWFAGALLTATVLRDARSADRIAMAFPDFARYRDLLRRTANSLSALRIEALLVDETGVVRWTDPTELTLRNASESLRRQRRPDSSGRIRTSSEARLTLHDAMTVVLRGAPDGRLPADELARQINQRGLYRMRDGRPVAIGQIYARARNYAHLFAAGNGAVTLRR